MAEKAEPQDVRAAGRGEAGGVNGLPLPPPAGAGDGDRTGGVDTVELDVEEAAAGQGGESCVEAIGPCRGDVDRVIEPFAGMGEADEVAAAGVGGALEIDGGGAVRRAAFVGGSRVVESDAFAAVVEIFRLDRVADVEGRALEGGRCGLGY